MTILEIGELGQSQTRTFLMLCLILSSFSRTHNLPNPRYAVLEVNVLASVGLKANKLLLSL